MHPKYKVRYQILPSLSICNALEQGPEEILRKKKFYDNLESSILNEGFRNPIMINAGYCPPICYRKLPQEMAKNPDTILVCCKWGGSRLWVAQKHGLEVPCLVSDFVDRFDGPDLTRHDVESILVSVREVIVTDFGLWAKAKIS